MQQSTISGAKVPTQKEAEKLFSRLIENEEQIIRSCIYDAEQFELDLENNEKLVNPASDWDRRQKSNWAQYAENYRFKAEYRRAQVAQLKAIFDALPAGE